MLHIRMMNYYTYLIAYDIWCVKRNDIIHFVLKLSIIQSIKKTEWKKKINFFHLKEWLMASCLVYHYYFFAFTKIGYQINRFDERLFQKSNRIKSFRILLSLLWFVASKMLFYYKSEYSRILAVDVYEYVYTYFFSL